VKSSPDTQGGGAHSQPKYYFVLDGDDRITFVPPGHADGLRPFLGQRIWALWPGAEPLFRDKFDEARRTGRETAFTTFYAGRTEFIRAVPTEDGLAVHVEAITELDVRSLSTLAESLLKIEAELAARAPEQLDRPVPSSPQALP
jgi:hypothetical protein